MITLIAAIETRVRRTDAADGGAKRVQRFDRFELKKKRATAEGFLFADGFLAKPGVLVYERGDGTVQRELIEPEELHNLDSLATLGHKPVTLEHPAEDVTPENIAALGVGEVSHIALVEGGYVRIEISVKRKDAINAFDDGVQELSPGYSCQIENTSGIHPVYGAYDAIQHDRRYNHAAITAAARGGRDIRLRADSAKHIPTTSEIPTMKPKFLQLLALLKVTRFDNEDVAVDAAIAKVDEMAAAITKASDAGMEIGGLKAQIAAKEKELADLKAKIATTDTANASAPAVDATIDQAMESDPPLDPVTATDAQKKTDAIRKAVSRAGNDRLRLEGIARSLRIDAPEVAKLGNANLRKLIVTTANPHARKDGSADYYRASVDMLPGAEHRADAEGQDPYKAMGDAFNNNTRRDGQDDIDPVTGKKRTDAAPSADEAFAANIKQAFNRRHGITA